MIKKAENHYFITAMPDTGFCEKWDDLLQNARLASHYVTPDFFADPFVGEGERFAVFAMEGDRLDAVLTGLRFKNTITSGLPVRPQIAFRDGIDQTAADALVRGVHSFDARQSTLIRLYSWKQIPGSARLGYDHEVCTGGNQVVMLDPGRGPEPLFTEFSERRRTNLRKMMKQGKIDVKILETEFELNELYEVHKDWCGRKGFAPDELDAFRANLNSEYRTVFIALHDRKIVAGTFLRHCKGGLVEYAANNSLAEYNHLRPNELLGWRAIEWVCSTGFSHFSLGASHPFLARYGGEIVAAHRYQLDRTFLKRHSNRERASRLAIKTYLSLPESIRRSIKSATSKI